MFVIFLVFALVTRAMASPQSISPFAVRINKCCERFEVIQDGRCTDAKTADENGTDTWQPIFTSESGEMNVHVQDFKFVIGLPDCGGMQMWPVYQYPSSTDKLMLLPDGRLRHLIKGPHDDDSIAEQYTKNDENPLNYLFNQGKYCMEKAITKHSPNGLAEFAMVCLPEKVIHWTDSDFLLRKIINPIFHGISMIILMTVAIIYFILPSLRDLVGNIVTTITLCLVISQAADLVRILTQFSSHVSFLVADAILYTSLLAAFFWLNSMGFYIWKTFRSRNVFLRVTDGRKYCYYSAYVWGVTTLMAALAIFAHFFLDTGDVQKQRSIFEDQETIGWLGIAVFFCPIAFIIIINLFFFVTTIKIMRRINTYGRIHHKLRGSFILFSLLFLIMTISWFFLILSWLEYDTLLYTHIFVNALQAPAIFYVAIIRQKHVTFLLRKTCCYNEPVATSDWGDELTYMNGGY
ncbi:probable G-protein coupled receptor Mth-like 5 [Culicoides brevitarsis]|uniref:probable G-protein coupled receptor Mth-like 5 n=1 Tax=Culicoides brevitarsis TaxID=469753 RepID=UPI00307BDCD4